MKNIRTTSIGAAAVLGAAALTLMSGLAAPAYAAPPVLDPWVTIGSDVDHRVWIQELQPEVKIPQIDNTIRHSGR